MFSFELEGRSDTARAGRFATPHGVVETPAFMVVGTHAAVRALTPEQVRATGTRVVLANTYHLAVRGRAELVERFGVESTMMRVGREEAIFDLQTAAKELSARFDRVEVARRHDHLYVTDAEVLGDYVRSACPATAENLARIQRLQDAVTEEIERLGSFHLTVAAGVCHARAPRTQAAAGS